MMSPTLASPPRSHDVVRAQIRAVGLGLRRPAMAGGALMVVATLLIATRLLGEVGPIHFHPEQLLLFGLAGVAMPMAVWKGEEIFGAAFFWTFPVDRRRHALARVFAGWVWLICAVAVFVLWLLVLALLSGENVLAQETMRLLPASAFFNPVSVDPQALQTVRVTPLPLLWLAPFTAATATYAFVSAMKLGLRRPLWWTAGVVLGLIILVIAGEAGNIAWLKNVGDNVFRPLVLGRYGFDTLLTARTELLKVGLTLANGENAVVWRALPSAGDWAVATILWMSVALTALFAGASRHRDRRRP